MTRAHIVVYCKFDHETRIRRYSYEWQGPVWRPARIHLLSYDDQNLRGPLPWPVVSGRYDIVSNSRTVYRVAGLTWLVLVPWEWIRPPFMRARRWIVYQLRRRGLADWHPGCYTSWSWIHWPWKRR